MSKYFKLTDQLVKTTGCISGWNGVMEQLRDAIREGQEENKFEKVSDDLGYEGRSKQYMHPFFIGKDSDGDEDGTTFKKCWWYKHHQMESYSGLLEGAEEL